MNMNMMMMRRRMTTTMTMTMTMMMSLNQMSINKRGRVILRLDATHEEFFIENKNEYVK